MKKIRLVTPTLFNGHTPIGLNTSSMMILQHPLELPGQYIRTFTSGGDAVDHPFDVTNMYMTWPHNLCVSVPGMYHHVMEHLVPMVFLGITDYVLYSQYNWLPHQRTGDTVRAIRENSIVTDEDINYFNFERPGRGSRKDGKFGPKSKSVLVKIHKKAWRIEPFCLF